MQPARTLRITCFPRPCPREGLASVPESKFQSLFSDHYYYSHYYYYYDYYYYYYFYYYYYYDYYYYYYCEY